MRLFVPLTRDEFDRLLQLARNERRRPQEQAAILITRTLTSLDAAPTTPNSITETLAPNTDQVRTSAEVRP